MSKSRSILWFLVGALSAVSIAACGSAAHAQKTGAPPSIEKIDPDSEPNLGKRLAMCPELKLRASHTSMKVLTENGAVLGSGLTGEKASIAKCEAGRIVWRRELNTIPTSIATNRSDDIYYAGMTPGDGIALAVARLDGQGQQKWFQRLDSPGDELGATIALSGWSGLYVLTASTGKLPGQPASAKGSRFLVRFDTNGKRQWVKQSPDFGRRPSRTGGGADGTPAALAADEYGNAYVLSALEPNGTLADKSGQARLAKLTKFSDKGRKIWQRVITTNVKPIGSPYFRGTLTAVAVDDDGSSVYVAGDAVVDSDPQLIVMRLDELGKPRWTRLVSLSYGHRSKGEYGETISTSGMVDEVRGIGVRSGSVLLVSSYQHDFIELPSEEEDEDSMGLGGVRDSSHVAAVVSLDSVRGSFQWARQYEGMGPEYGSASEIQPYRIQLLSSGAVAISGSEDIWVAQTSQSHEDVAALFLLSDTQVDALDFMLPTAAEMEFFLSIKDAVEIGDKQWLADQIAYPLCCSPGPGGSKVNSKADFLKHYDFIFNDHVRAAIAGYAPQDLFKNDQGLMVGDGELWFAPLQPKGAAASSLYIITINNDGDPAPKATPEVEAAPTPEAKATPTPEVTAEAKPVPDADKPPLSKRDKIKAFFKEQNRQIQEKNKQKNQNQK